jgi:hypothetical protein
MEVDSTTLLFSNLMTNPSDDDNFNAKIQTTVTGFTNSAVVPLADSILSEVTFKFEWLSGADSNWAMKEIDVFDGIFSGGAVDSFTGTVSFSGAAGDPGPQIGNNLDDKGVYGGDSNEPGYIQPSQFDPTFGYIADVNQSNNNAVQPGETLTLSFGLSGVNTTWADVLGRLSEGTYFDDANDPTGKVGVVIHVGSIDSDAGSEWAYNEPPDDGGGGGGNPPVPEPTTVVVWSLLLGMGLAYRRTR